MGTYGEISYIDRQYPLLLIIHIKEYEIKYYSYFLNGGDLFVGRSKSTIIHFVLYHTCCGNHPRDSLDE
jgi:hypothetical protein